MNMWVHYNPQVGHRVGDETGKNFVKGALWTALTKPCLWDYEVWTGGWSQRGCMVRNVKLRRLQGLEQKGLSPNYLSSVEPDLPAFGGRGLILPAILSFFLLHTHTHADAHAHTCMHTCTPGTHTYAHIHTCIPHF